MGNNILDEMAGINENRGNDVLDRMISDSPNPELKIMSSQIPVPEWASSHPDIYRGAVDVYKYAGKPAIETLGMLGGGAIGAASGFAGGLGLGAIPGAGLGAGLGYAGARNLTGAIDQAIGIDRGVNVTPQKILKETGKDFLMGAVAPPVTPTLKPTLQAAKSGYGVTLLPGEVTGSKTLAQVESLLEQTPFASDVIQNWRQKEQLTPLIALRNRYIQTGQENTPRGEILGQQIKKIIDTRLSQFDKAKVEATDGLRDNILKQLGSNETYETLSKEAQQTINKASANAVTRKNELYKAVSEVMPEGELPFSNYQQIAEKHLIDVSKSATPDPTLTKVLKWGTNVKQLPEELAFLESIAQYPPQAQQQLMEKAGISKVTEITKDWRTMQNHRNELNDLIKANDLSIKNNAPGLKGQLSNEGRIYKDLRTALDADFEQIAKDKGGNVLERWNTAQAFYSNEYAPVWKQKTIRDMAYKNPSELVNVAIKPNSTMEIDLAKKALGEDGFNKTLKPAFTNKLLKSDIEGAFDPAQFEKKLNSYGNETLSKIYTQSELEQLRSVASNGKIILDKELPNASLLKSLSKIDNGQVLVNSVISAIEKTPNSTSLLKNLSAVNNILGEPQKQGLKTELLERVFKLNQITQQVEPTAMAKNINNLKESLKMFMTPKEMGELRNIAILGDVMSKAQQMAANPSGTAKNVIAFGTANELIFKPLETLMKGKVLDAAGQMAVAGVSKILGAKTLAKIYTSPGGRRLITKAMTTPRYTSQGIDIAKKISIIAGNDLLDAQ